MHTIFCFRFRWALDHAQIPSTRRKHCPRNWFHYLIGLLGFHVFPQRHCPVPVSFARLYHEKQHLYRWRRNTPMGFSQDVFYVAQLLKILKNRAMFFMYIAKAQDKIITRSFFFQHNICHIAFAQQIYGTTNSMRSCSQTRIRFFF